MSLRAFEPLDEARIVEICSQGTAESQTLDFKQTLPGTSDRDKAEFLKDVCALANADGGDLVYGIAEHKGVASAPAPIVGEAADAAKRRLGQVAEAGLEPRVIGLEFRHVAVQGGYALIVRVPASFNGPHRYGPNGKFVMRNGTHTSELTYDQLRSAFDRRATLAERARRFREQRLHLIKSMKVGKGLMHGPKAVGHLIPISAMAETSAVDVQGLYRMQYTRLQFPEWSGGMWRAMNLDGLLVYADDKAGMKSYFQLFRNGAMEAGRFAGSVHSQGIIPGTVVTTFFYGVISRLLDEARMLKLSGPGVIGTTLMSIGDNTFAVSRELFNEPGRTDRDDLIFPEIWIDRLEESQDVASIAKPVLDMLWQAFDFERCFEIDEHGHWVRR